MSEHNIAGSADKLPLHGIAVNVLSVSKCVHVKVH
jgi:hypothetical protein